MFQKFFKHVSNMFQTRFSNMFHNVQIVSKRFKMFQNVSKMFQKFFKNVSKMFQNFSKCFSGGLTAAEIALPAEVGAAANGTEDGRRAAEGGGRASRGGGAHAQLHPRRAGVRYIIYCLHGRRIEKRTILFAFKESLKGGLWC
jgi:hypothetical protein